MTDEWTKTAGLGGIGVPPMLHGRSRPCHAEASFHTRSEIGRIAHENAAVRMASWDLATRAAEALRRYA